MIRLHCPYPTNKNAEWKQLTGNQWRQNYMKFVKHQSTTTQLDLHAELSTLYSGSYLVSK